MNTVTQIPKIQDLWSATKFKTRLKQRKKILSTCWLPKECFTCHQNETLEQNLLAKCLQERKSYLKSMKSRPLLEFGSLSPALRTWFGARFLRRRWQNFTCQTMPVWISSIKNICLLYFKKVLNTVQPGFVDTLFRNELEKRKFADSQGTTGITVEPSFLPLLKSELFAIGPGRFTSMIRRARLN